MSFVRRLMCRTMAVALLPLSLVPLYVLSPGLVRGPELWLRHNVFAPEPWKRDRRVQPAPAVALTPDQRDLFVPLPAYKGAVPVLVYHGINERKDHYSISREDFARQMAMLRNAGFHAISIARYTRFLRGDVRGLPLRPVLITFDDGRLDSYRGADAVLRKHGMRATMFVITGEVQRRNPFYLRWAELRRMARSGRWDLQPHAHDGHVNVMTSARGTTGPAYANRTYRDGSTESFTRYARRVGTDILHARTTMARNIPGFRSLAFAVPYGEVGQNGTNDPRIPRSLPGFLGRHFAATFLVGPAAYTTPATARTALPRYELHTETTLAQLYRWLDGELPAAQRAQHP